MDSALRIQWVADGVQGNAADGYASTLASNRYRVLAPLTALGRQPGVAAELLAAKPWDAATQTAGRADVVIIGKVAPGGDPARVHALSRQVLEQLRVAQAAGVKVVADFNDDHFARPGVGGYWQELARQVDVCVAGSAAMEERLRDFTPAPVHVIGDPVLAPALAPRVFRSAGMLARVAQRVMRGPAARLRLLWFGNINNWPALLPWAEALVPIARSQPWLLRVVTSPFAQARLAIDDFNRRHAPHALIEFVPWNEQAQAEMLAESHVVLLPSDPADRTKSVKTANRLTDALQAGNYVLASELPSYRPYAEAAVLTDTPLLAMRAYLGDPAAARRRIERGQALVSESASPDVCAQAWLRASEKARSARDRAPMARSVAQAEVPLVRLNLGCGDKILAGYVNVDLANNWSGKQPDVVADVTKRLPFPDAYADEVHAYHVLEHLYRWTAEDCIREWMRVLKPGGLLILEMPCLDKILGLFDHFRRAQQPPNPRLTMWALYGDPNYRNEPMTHRWCYSIDELTRLLVGLGLYEVQNEEPQTHIKARDMRVVGVKPLVQ